jgi:hypothetical protein
MGAEPTTSLVEPYRVSVSTSGGRFNTLRAPLAPTATWMLEDIHFALDSSFIQPEAAEAFALLAAIRHDNPGAPLSLFGHADQSGDEAYNKTLGGRRAIAVYAMLTRRVDLWEQLYSHPFGNDTWGDPALQVMIDTVHKGTSPAPGPSASSASSSSASSASASSPAKTSRPPSPDKAARAMLFRDYMDEICRDLGGTPFTLDPTTDFLARGADKDGKGDYQGCGELNPVLILSAAETRALAGDANKAARAAANAPKRRVTGVFLAAGAKVEPAKWRCPRATEGNAVCHKRLWSDAPKRARPGLGPRTQAQDGETFACRFYDRLFHGERHAEQARLVPISMRLLDENGKPNAGLPYTITVSGVSITGTTNADGRLSARVPSTAVEGTLQVDGFTIKLELNQLPPVTTVLGVQARLRHLGYYGGPLDGANDPDTREALRAFQNARNKEGAHLVENGDPSDPMTQAALVEAHGS